MAIDSRLHMAEQTLLVLEMFQAYGRAYRQEQYKAAERLFQQSENLYANYHSIIAGAMDCGLIPNPVDHPIAFTLHIRRQKAYLAILRTDLEPEEIYSEAERMYIEPPPAQEDTTIRANIPAVSDGISGQ